MRVCDAAFDAIRAMVEENPEFAVAVEKELLSLHETGLGGDTC
jgi:hypothetical protein